MAIPHLIQMQKIKERLHDLDGKAKLNEIKKIQSELPGFNTGPYGKIKQWLREEIKKTKIKSEAKHQDWLGVKRQGTKQFVLVGYPSVGKSSLIKKLSGLQTKVAAYDFTTLKPIPGTINVHGAYFQIVDLPGIVEGADNDVGGGKRLIGIIKNTDGIILMHDLSKPLSELIKIVKELENVNIKKPTLIIGNKLDLKGSKENLKKLKKRFPNNTILGLSVNNDNLTVLKEELWKMSNLIRVFTVDKKDCDPIILEKGSTIKDFVEKIHKDLLKKFKLAKVTGKSAKFPNQTSGLSHILEDKDIVEVISEI